MSQDIDFDELLNQAISAKNATSSTVYQYSDDAQPNVSFLLGLEPSKPSSEPLSGAAEPASDDSTRAHLVNAEMIKLQGEDEPLLKEVIEPDALPSLDIQEQTTSTDVAGNEWSAWDATQANNDVAITDDFFAQPQVDSSALDDTAVEYEPIPQKEPDSVLQDGLQAEEFAINEENITSHAPAEQDFFNQNHVATEDISSNDPKHDSLLPEVNKPVLESETFTDQWTSNMTDSQQDNAEDDFFSQQFAEQTLEDSRPKSTPLQEQTATLDASPSEQQTAQDLVFDSGGFDGEDFFTNQSTAAELDNTPAQLEPLLDNPDQQQVPKQENLEDLWGDAFGDDNVLLENDSTPKQGLSWENDDDVEFLNSDTNGTANGDLVKSELAHQAAAHPAEISWDDAFADDDDFLSGFAEAAAAAAAAVQPQPSQAEPVRPRAASGSYLPKGVSVTQPSKTPNTARNNFYQLPQPAAPIQNAPPSSVRLSGKYDSPYDLPEDFVKKPTKKKATVITPSAGNFAAPPPSGVSPIQPPSRSTSLPPFSNQARNVAPPAGAQSPAIPQNKENFFEDLPVASRQRTSTPSGRYTPQFQPSPSISAPPIGPPMGSGIVPPVSGTSYSPSPVSQSYSPQPSPSANQAYSPRPAQAPPAGLNRTFSAPAPPPISASQPDLSTQLLSSDRLAPYSNEQDYLRSATVPAPIQNRYSPAPPLQKPTQTRYVSDPGQPRAQLQQYAPRTSSPLTYSSLPQDTQPLQLSPEQPFQQPHHRDTSFQRLHSSLSHSALATVEENQVTEPIQPQLNTQTSFGRQNTPPPPQRSGPSSITSSPRKRNNYVPLATPPDNGFVPPKRSQTSSPGAALKASRTLIAATERPASAQGALSPTRTRAIPIEKVLPSGAPSSAPVGLAPKNGPQLSQMIPPQNELANDPLGRWQGHPVFAWGGSGTVLTAFPTYLPRYIAGQALPLMQPGGGEFKVRNITSLATPPEQLAKFPGPLKKGKKKEISAWLKVGIEKLETQVQSQAQYHSGYDLTRLQERLLLWQVLALLVEHDGVLDGTPAVTEEVKKLLAVPEQSQSRVDMNVVESSASILPDAPTPKELGPLKAHLTQGEGEKAVWHAVDQRLWGPAFLIASTLSKDIWKQVIQEFVRKEVKDKSLAALFQVLAGNWDESIDELVSVSARAGFQMVNTATGPSTEQDALSGLEKWRETLLLVLSNRSPGDAQSLVAIGRVLAGYGRVEAAHICFIFAGAQAQFGGSDDAATHFSLVGTDPVLVGIDFGGDIESILLSEVYEYALSIAPTPITPLPHMQAYKLYHAEILAENGLRSEAQQYCDAVNTTVHSKTKSSPYYNVVLMQAIDALGKRLSEAPVDSSGSWKPSIGQVSNSLWSKFNNFVAGDEKEETATPPNEPGQFQRFAGDTPPSSAAPSNTDLYSAYQGGAPAAPANSRYAPSNAYAPNRGSEQPAANRYQPGGQSSYQPRTSQESTRSSQEAQSLSPKRMSSYASLQQPVQPFPGQGQMNGGLDNQPTFAPSNSYIPSPYQPTPPAEAAFGGYSPQPAEPPNGVVSYGYQPVAQTPNLTETAPPPTFEQSTPQLNPEESTYQPGPSSWEPPSTSYEPYSYQPYEPEAETSEEPTKPEGTDGLALPLALPKKKSFMDDDDDDDDILARAAALKSKGKTDADRATDDAFRKAAEADAARPPPITSRSSWLGGWFKKQPSVSDLNEPRKAVKANLGDKSSFVFDPETKRWVNKAAGASTAAPTPAGTPPPPKGTGTPPPPRGLGTPPPPRSSTPASSMPPPTSAPSSTPVATGGPPPPMSRTTSMPTPSGTPPIGTPPTSRPGTSAGPAPSRSAGTSDIDDLLGAPMPRVRGAAAKGKKKGRYVDVMAGKVG